MSHLTLTLTVTMGLTCKQREHPQPGAEHPQLYDCQETQGTCEEQPRARAIDFSRQGCRPSVAVALTRPR